MKSHSSLELFILSCIDRQLQTPYDLSRQAGLSLGATTPALKRLLKAGLVKRTVGSTSSRRPRHEYELTPAGRQLARSGWKQYLRDPNPDSDLDALFRILDMASHYGSSKSAMKDFLVRAMEARRKSTGVWAAIAEQRQDTGFLYLRLKAELDTVRSTSEFDALARIHSWFKRAEKQRVYQGSLLDTLRS